MAAVRMGMGVTHRSEANNVDYQAKHTDNKELVEATKLVTFPDSFKGIQNDFETHEAKPYISRRHSAVDGVLSHQEYAVGEA